MAVVVPKPAGATAPAENNVYTALLVIATVFVITATICLAVQYHSFYGLETLFSGTPTVGN